MENREIEIIEIFDIDDCIVRSTFKNKEIINITEIRKEILQTSLNHNFIIYFNSIRNNPGIRFFFLTGRKFSHYSFETKIQLKPLNLTDNIKIIYYPEIFDFSKKTYFNFKITRLLDICLKYPHSIINIYDDHHDYFCRLLYLANKMRIKNLNTHLVKDINIFWKSKLKNF